MHAIIGIDGLVNGMRRSLPTIKMLAMTLKVMGKLRRAANLWRNYFDSFLISSFKDL